MSYKDEFLNYCNSTIWKDDTPGEEIRKISLTAYNDMKINKTKQKKVFRICGQSGSGKTTQLLYAINENMKNTELNPVIIAVRNFAIYHPQYKEFLERYGQSEIREKTNGFALKLLCLTLVEFVKNGYMIVMDITLLSEEFEKIVLDLFRFYQYEREYLVMSVPKRQSDEFINKRMTSSGTESSRIVYQSSSDFFYNILPQSIKFLSCNDINSICSIWNAYQREPVYFGKIENCLTEFYKNREEIKENEVSEEELRIYKKNFFANRIKNLENL